MRNRLSSQMRQQTDICIFCFLRGTTKPTINRNASRQISKPYSISSKRFRPGGQAAAEKSFDDDEDEFPLLKKSAGSSWQPSITKPIPSTSKIANPEPTFRIRRQLRDFTKPEHDTARNERSQENGPGLIFNNRPPRREWQNRDNRPQREMPKYTHGDRIIPRTNQTVNRNTTQTLQSQESYEKPIYKTFKPIFIDEPEATSSGKSANGNTRRDPIIAGSLQSQTTKQSVVKEHANNATTAGGVSERNNSYSAEETTRRNQTVKEDEEIDAKPDSNFRSRFANSRFDTDQVEETVDAPQRTIKERFAKNSRFNPDDEEDVQLPAAPAQYNSSKGDTRSRASAMKFDLDEYEFEAEFDEEEFEGRKDRRRRGKRQPKNVQRPTVTIPEYMSVQQLAQTLGLKADALVAKLEEEGFEGARHDHMLDAETSAMFADIYEFDVAQTVEEFQDLLPRPPAEDRSSLPPRPPIVTIMGHVDHGKTTILDWLRKSSVAAGEHGGITQHIGAFSVTMPGSERQITFLDTPGHEAFLDMRKRGANVTDIVVLVVAADDSVKPQTIEAIKHALDAKVQLIVAINKVDKYDADIEKVKQDLTTHDIVVEDYGGDYQAIAVSGKTGQGMEQLEEAIITLSDVLDLRAEKDGPAEGSIIESKLTAAGRAATILVRRGTLRIGDFIVAGQTWGRVRTLRNDSGILVKEAVPGDPVQMDGWRGEDPVAGLEVLQADNEHQAKSIVDLRQNRAAMVQSASDAAALNAAKTQEAEARAKVLAWEAENDIKARRRRHDEGWTEASNNSGPKQIHFVVKADVAGSVEAIVHAISSIGNHEIQAHVVHSGTGPLTESDIRMLAVSGETCYAISFNQQVDNVIQNLAQSAGLEVLDHNIIYRVTEAVRDRLQEALPPIITQKVLGQAEINQIFEYTLKNKQKLKIAGCKISNGTINKARDIRVIREGEIVFTGSLESLKNVKKDVTEMSRGSECGMAFTGWSDFQEGDSVQSFEEKSEKRQLY